MNLERLTNMTEEEKSLMVSKIRTATKVMECSDAEWDRKLRELGFRS